MGSQQPQHKATAAAEGAWWDSAQVAWFDACKPARKKDAIVQCKICAFSRIINRTATNSKPEAVCKDLHQVLCQVAHL
jgi:hypothetical protein